MKVIYRSVQNKIIAGICGGVGEYLSVDPTLVRIIAVFLGLATGLLPFILTYAIGWLIIPVPPQKEQP